jgi:hypothetical protein
MQEKLTGILSKAVKSRKKEIIVAENIFGNTLFLPVPAIEMLYATSYKLSMFNFQRKHHEALKISTAELDRIEKNLVATMSLNTKADPKDTMEHLIAVNLMTSSDVVLKYGEQIEVIAQPQLAAVKVIILYYPEYLIVKSNYLPIRGGNKLFEEVTMRTKGEFEGVVPGRWKWNLGNWVNKQGRITSVENPQGSVPNSTIKVREQVWELPAIINPQGLPDKMRMDPIKRKEMENIQRTEEYRTEIDEIKKLEADRQKALEQNIVAPIDNEASTAAYDDYFN